MTKASFSTDEENHSLVSHKAKSERRRHDFSPTPDPQSVFYQALLQAENLNAVAVKLCPHREASV